MNLNDKTNLETPLLITSRNIRIRGTNTSYPVIPGHPLPLNICTSPLKRSFEPLPRRLSPSSMILGYDVTGGPCESPSRPEPVSPFWEYSYVPTVYTEEPNRNNSGDSLGSGKGEPGTGLHLPSPPTVEKTPT